MTIENVQKVLLECYSKDLCYPKVQDDWNENNKCFGMCAITSLIITLGEFLTRNLLNFKFNKFADVVGNIYEVNGYKILPIYHPSPISPKSYKGNVPIFKKLKLTNNF